MENMLGKEGEFKARAGEKCKEKINVGMSFI